MDHIRGLRFGRLPPGTVHLCVDMQRVFAQDSPWASDAVASALPATREICRWKPAATIFTRFIRPHDARAVRGQWAAFYAGCPAIEKLDPRLFDIVPELATISTEARVVDRFVFSAFRGSQLQALLEQRSTDTLVFSGVETDVCVLATVLEAIDFGYRVVVIEEAVASSNAAGHRSAMTGIFPRFDQQIELVGVSELLGQWR